VGGGRAGGGGGARDELAELLDVAGEVRHGRRRCGYRRRRCRSGRGGRGEGSSAAAALLPFPSLISKRIPRTAAEQRSSLSFLLFPFFSFGA
jgi:hypothetical protein